MAAKVDGQGRADSASDAISTPDRVQEMIDSVVGTDPAVEQSATAVEAAPTAGASPQAQDESQGTADATDSTPAKTPDGIEPVVGAPENEEWAQADSQMNALVAQLESKTREAAQAGSERDQLQKDHGEATRWGQGNLNDARSLSQELDASQKREQELEQRVQREEADKQALLGRIEALEGQQTDPYAYADPYADPPAAQQPDPSGNPVVEGAQSREITELRDTVDALTKREKQRAFDERVNTLTAQYNQRKSMLMGPQFLMSEREANTAVRAHAEGNSDAFTDMCLNATRRVMSTRDSNREAAGSTPDLTAESEGTAARSTSAPRRPSAPPLDALMLDPETLAGKTEPEMADARTRHMMNSLFRE